MDYMCHRNSRQHSCRIQPPLRKTALPVVWEGERAQSRFLDPIDAGEVKTMIVKQQLIAEIESIDNPATLSQLFEI